MGIQSDYSGKIYKDNSPVPAQIKLASNEQVFSRHMIINGKECKISLIVPSHVNIKQANEIFKNEKVNISRSMLALGFDKKGELKNKVRLITLNRDGTFEIDKKDKNKKRTYTPQEIDAKIRVRLGNF
jgi:hypothetical protein